MHTYASNEISSDEIDFKNTTAFERFLIQLQFSNNTSSACNNGHDHHEEE